MWGERMGKGGDNGGLRGAVIDESLRPLDRNEALHQASNITISSHSQPAKCTFAH